MSLLLIPLAQIHRTGFLLYHGYAQERWELGLFLALSQALGDPFLGGLETHGFTFL